jgi:hypothetical protein
MISEEDGTKVYLVVHGILGIGKLYGPFLGY